MHPLTLLFFYCGRLSQKNDDCKSVKSSGAAKTVAISDDRSVGELELLRRKIGDVEGDVPEWDETTGLRSQLRCTVGVARRGENIFSAQSAN
ncbi:hypothetical protein ACFQ15_06620 [Sphingomonas hankookensis]|uniref:hypothetical protein n=1 Tax=Sphingomonas hankookensis TaxID=563996 RepID=UPI001F5669CC|nr:hypothetical protein [Sphingomonas hankookensis]